MPDLLHVFARRWKMMLSITFLASLLALVIALIAPKKYLSVATALPVNSVTSDKARVFNSNIEALYSDFGSPDELDRIEGTAMLDTIFISASQELSLKDHYAIKDGHEAVYKAARRLKKNTRINRSSYGELKVKVWDQDRDKAAQLANFLMQKLQELHQHLQNQSNLFVLAKIKDEYEAKQKEFLLLDDSLIKHPGALSSAGDKIAKTKMTALVDQLQQYEKMMGEYQLAVHSNSPVLLVVENARPSLWADKPDVLLTVLFVFFSGLLFSFLVALFLENRKKLN